MRHFTQKFRKGKGKQLFVILSLFENDECSEQGMVKFFIQSLSMFRRKIFKVWQVRKGSLKCDNIKITYNIKL